MAEVNPRVTGLEAWWSLNEASGSRADSHGANTLTDINTVTQAAGKVGNAAQFVNANSEILQIADNPALSFGDEDFTIGGWFYLDNKTTTQFLLGKLDWFNNDREYVIYFGIGENRLIFSVSSNGTAFQAEHADVLGIPALATWYFIVAWHDASGNTINIQINNAAVDSAAYALGCNDNISDFVIGGSFIDGVPENEMDGRADESFVYRRVLTADERSWLWNSGNGRAYSELAIVIEPPAATISLVGQAPEKAAISLVVSPPAVEITMSGQVAVGKIQYAVAAPYAVISIVGQGPVFVSIIDEVRLTLPAERDNLILPAADDDLTIPAEKTHILLPDVRNE